MNKYEILKTYFGYDSFRGAQEILIDNILSGKDVLGIMPTGAGKSLCYQIPALMLDGITLVISPLISLMKDQVGSLNQAGIHAAYLNSSLTPGQYRKALAFARQGRYPIIYVAPERLLTPEFLDFAMNVRISMVAVDEAHCVSQWGQDFRPSYLRIADFIQGLPVRPVVSAFTATATKEVRDDILELLELRDPMVMSTGFDRENLYFEVQRTKEKKERIREYLEKHSDESGIIYCATRKNVDEVYELLWKRGVPVAKYHAGMDTEARKKSQEDFIYDRLPVIVATNAFGMGIDKSNVRYVIHYNMPQSMENYYQEAGRAGRDGEPPQCILLFSARDVMIDKFLLEHKDFSEVPPEDIEPIRQRDARRLQIMEGYCQTTSCFRNYILTYFGEKVTSPCDNCGNCHREYHEVDMTAEAKAVLDCVSETKGRYGQAVVVGTLLGANRARLKELGTIHYKSYGSLKDLGEKEIKSLIHQMIVEGYLYQTDDQYSVLKIGNKTLAELENATILVKMYEEKEPSRRQQRGSRRRNTDMLTGEGFELFELLRGLRLEIAREEAVPPYIIFSDKTLIDMCVKLPEDRGTMLDVSGVGQAKYEKYGQRFLTAIREYREKQGDMEICETAEEAAGLPEAESQKGTFDRTEYNRAHNRPEGASRTWDAAEDEELKREFGFGMKIAEIARQHDRTYGAIRARLKKQGMIE